jgi:hypothetical protein
MTVAFNASRAQLTFADIGRSVRRVAKKCTWPIIIGCSVLTGYLVIDGNPAWHAFVYISGSSAFALYCWTNSGRSLPLFALLVLQNLILYGLPIVSNNASLRSFTPDEITSAGIQVLIFNLAMLIAWQGAMRLIRTGGRTCYALLGLDSASLRLTVLGLALVAISTLYHVLVSTQLLDIVLDILPAGSYSIFSAVSQAVSACGFFLSGMMIGGGTATKTHRILFWSMFALQCTMTASGFLLSASVLIILSSCVGLFWGSGRIPWRLLIAMFVVFGFLNLGKFEMRDKYWNFDDEGAGDTRFIDIPSRYAEWASASIDVLSSGSPKHDAARLNALGSDEAEVAAAQTLTQRINNLGNLLYAIDVMWAKKLEPLDGATYALIPPLLIPRILWPEKPRTHEGQVMLNVYFGRQDLESTFRTYIAWGLLAEAYGNFGPIKGALILGLALGFVCGWIEQAVCNKLVLSLEGFLSFTLFLMFANSYEMVASVFVTAVFQSFVPIVIASAPFVARITPPPARATGGIASV